MRKIALAIVLALSLSGCASLQLLTQDYNNPITRQTLYDVENGMILVFAGLNTYKSSCNRGLIPPSCHVAIAKVQVYTRQISPMLKQLRAFVKNNDQVNARVVYNTIIGFIESSRNEALANGITIGAK